jgi:hypothetical protein
LQQCARQLLLAESYLIMNKSINYRLDTVYIIQTAFGVIEDLWSLNLILSFLWDERRTRVNERLLAIIAWIVSCFNQLRLFHD